MKKQTWRLIFLLSTFHWDTEITQCKCLNEILDCKRMMFGKLWKELWSFYAGHWWLFRITKTWSENRQQVENFQFLVSKLSIARQNAVSQRNNFLTDRNFIWFCGKNRGDIPSLVMCSTVPSRFVPGLSIPWKRYFKGTLTLVYLASKIMAMRKMNNRYYQYYHSS